MKDSIHIPFTKNHLVGTEIQFLKKTLTQSSLVGDGEFGKKCESWLNQHLDCHHSLLSPSGTAALEMSALLLDIKPGDEIIMPSYTFVSTANAFVLRGGVPVFVDIRPDTLNLDETKIEEVITPRTRAIVAVHYAGVACEMDEIKKITKKNNLYLIEDAAQAFLSRYKGKWLGSLGDLSACSFHGTKNISCGEGGALLINQKKFIRRAEIIREKGTNRSQFVRGEIDKYSWVEVGSSYLPSELQSAFLYAQLKQSHKITNQRLKLWNLYHEGLKQAEKEEKLTRPVVPSTCQHNGHMYYIILPSPKKRDQLIKALNKKGIQAVTHYVPLHSSPAGKKQGRTAGDLKVTARVSRCLVRLPLWIGIEKQIDWVLKEVIKAL